MAETTPQTPWTHDHFLIRHLTGGTDEDGAPFSEVIATALNTPTAALICRAVNAHAGLVAALEGLIEGADSGEWHNSQDCKVEQRTDDCHLCQMLIAARTALAAALEQVKR